jgi:hypothetical protein
MGKIQGGGRRMKARRNGMDGFACLAMCAGLFWAPMAYAGDFCSGTSGDCFLENGTPGCDDAVCCNAICAEDNFCCATEWDSLCVQAALLNPACGVGPSSGACCLPDGTCEIAGAPQIDPDTFAGATCDDLGGIYQGDGALCDDVTCVGACCIPVLLANGAGSFNCEEIGFGSCSDLGGAFNGLGVMCVMDIEEPVLGGDVINCNAEFGPGACCFGANTECVFTNVADCAVNGGIWFGEDSYCDGVTTFGPEKGDPETFAVLCNDYGPCCFPGGYCERIFQSVCELEGGVFQGAGQFCFDVNCPQNFPCPGFGGCFEENGTPGCDDGFCCQLVCSVDSFCCEVEWDAICVGEANYFCTGTAGACCLPTGLCEIVVDPAECDDAGGVFNIGTLCSIGLCPITNDECEQAIRVNDLPAYYQGFIGTAEPDELLCDAVDLPLNGSYESLPGVWFRVEGTGSELIATMCDVPPVLTGSSSGASAFIGSGPGSIEYQISVYCGSCANLTCVGFSDGGCAGMEEILTLGGMMEFGAGLPEVTWCSVEGVSYFILVTYRADPNAFPVGIGGGISSLGGPMGFGFDGFYELFIADTQVPCESTVDCLDTEVGTDECAAAVIVCPGILYEDNTFDATNEAFEQGVDFQTAVMHCGLFFGVYDEWYAYRPAWDGQVFIGLSGVNGPTLEWVYAVYDDCGGTPDQQIACNDTQHASILFDGKRGETYWIRVARRGYDRGQYQFTITGPDCAPNAADLNNNNVPDIQECIEDVTGDGVVDFADFVQVIVSFNQCPGCCCDPIEDVDGNTHVDAVDAMIVYEAIGRVCQTLCSMQDFIDGRRPLPNSPKGGDGSAITVQP